MVGLPRRSKCQLHDGNISEAERALSIAIPKAPTACALASVLENLMASSVQDKQQPSKIGPDCHFTVFIRLPFPRYDFVDPPPVAWDSLKDRALWDILYRAEKGREVDWQALASEFDVTLRFLLQQAAWLYERQLSQVRAQLRKVNRPSSIGNSPTPGSISNSAVAGGQAMTRATSCGSRVPSSLSNRPKERPVSRAEGRTVEMQRPTRTQQMSSNSSTSTVFQVRKPSPSTLPRSPREIQSSFTHTTRTHERSRRPVEASPKQQSNSLARSITPSLKAEASSTSSSSDSDNLGSVSQSRVFTRRPRYPAPKAPMRPLSDADKEDEDSPPFLPFSDTKAIEPLPSSDPSATLRIPRETASSHRTAVSSTSKAEQPPHQNFHSSSSSAQSQPQLRKVRPAQAQTPLSTLSPRQRRIAKEGSEGTPSMGSSFSDLDDASVTQSALEEALANEMTHGGVASRMSTISQALRSRYL